MTRIVVVSGGLGSPSSTRLLGDRLAEAVRRAAGTGPDGAAPVEVETVELRDLAVPLAHHLLAGFPGPELGAALDKVASADGIIAVTPVFSASYSGLFKSFFDVLDPDALTGKPVLIGATGGTPRHSLVVEHALRPLFAHLRAVVAPTGVYAASQDWGADGLAERIDRAGRELALLVRESAPVTAAPGGTAPERESGAESGQGFPAESVQGYRVVPFAEQLAAVRAA
ncbi:FMN reductase [Streptomyces physcomitrii]|uniref:FMN reductase n=1 Tax=Streptomyces physcomitrii TaxID=2724184 RepID=UPI0034348319